MSEQKKENNKKIKKSIVIVLAVILILCVGVYAKNWKQIKDIKISSGLSDSHFPYRDYTQEELNKMYPQIKNADVPTRTTPEQTYAALKQALKNEDVDAAVNCFVEEKRGEWRENLKKIKEKGFMQEMEQDLTGLKLESAGEAFSSYTFDHVDKIGDTVEHHISFIKDSNGDWKIKSL